MQQRKVIFPIVYGVISAIISYLAIFIICFKTLQFSLPIATFLASLSAILFFVLSWFRGHASVEIKRITQQYKLTSTDLAEITGRKKTDFPIYKGKLQLILPKRHWAKVLVALENYEKEQLK